MLPSLPYEVWEHIALHAAHIDDDHNILTTLISLLLTARDVHDNLLGAPAQPANDALFALIFDYRFDTAAPHRRLSPRKPIPSYIRAAELKIRIPVLRRVAACQLDRYDHSDALAHDLWHVYLMLLDDDGKNSAQLHQAHVEHFAKEVLHAAASVLDEDGWPIESILAQLAGAILSIVCDVDAVLRESAQEREDVINAFHPFFIAPHRYPITHRPITRFTRDRDPPRTPPHPHTLRSLATMPTYAPTALHYMGRALRLSPPLLAESAICATVLRNERVDTAYSRDIPRDRAAADAIAWPRGITQMDWEESNLQRRMALGVEVPRAGGPREAADLAARGAGRARGSVRWDADFWRMACAALESDERAWVGTVYVPGMLAGKWIGRLIMPSWRAHTRMLHMHPAPLRVVYQGLDEEADIDQVYQPMQLTLREHIATDALQHVGCGDRARGDGVQNAWFPAELGVRGMRETGTELVIRDPREDVAAWASKRYTTWCPGVELPPGPAAPAFPLVEPERFEEEEEEEVPSDVEEAFSEFGLERVVGPHPDAPGEMLVERDEEEDDEMYERGPQYDVILTGETDYPHGKAYGAYRVYGRVRRCDGLVVFIRTPQIENGGGRWIFRGYVRAGGAIIGRWRESAADLDAGAYEGPFVLCRVGEAWGPYGV